MNARWVAELLEELVRTIDALRVRIKDHRQYLESYESRTRISLVNPLIHALGWDLSDPAQIEIEPAVANGWADYGLLNEKGLPIALIEAKKLAETNADAALTQSSAYLMTHNRNNSRKIIYCGWTNGDKWEIVDVTKQATVMKVSLTQSRTTSAKIALGLLGLWRSSFEDGSYDDAAMPLFAPQVQTGAPGSISSNGNWISLSSDFAAKGRPAPSAIKFPDGQEFPISHWRDVLKEVARSLIRKGSLRRENSRIRSGHSRFITSPDGIHPSGKPFGKEFRLGNSGIHLECHNSADACIRFSRKLLIELGHDPGEVFLEFSREN